MTNKPSLATFMLVLCLAGCAQHQTMYQWGDYDTLLYRSYKEPDKTVVLQRRLEAHITQLEQSQLKVAPGLYAELGTLYLQTGDAAKATAYYRKERDAWPESRALMDTLIQHASERKPVQNVAGTEVKS